MRPEEVKQLLSERGISQKEVIEYLNGRDIRMDYSEMSHILSGTRRTPKASRVLSEVRRYVESRSKTV